MFKSNPEMIEAAARVTRVLVELPIGETAEYSSLAAAAGFDVLAKRHVLTRAIEYAEEKTRGRFACVRCVGVQRLAAEALPGIGEQAQRSIHGKASRASTRLSGLAANDIPAETRVKIDMHRSLLGAIAGMTKRPRRVSDTPPPTPPTLPKGAA